ncbi:MAG: hypothetical protein GY913_24540 [Proteobacteria bacterium]|nr:hypothetical protein [Pseudomonadota bacterium]MCP4920083.1 hypothetical protein [Pseudomonadota bacterium]
MILALLACAEPTLTIGYGVAGDFIPYVEGEVVTMTTAPQGGFGVPIRASTTDLFCGTDEQPNAPFEVLLETRIDGEVSASFVNDTAVLYCQDDETGLVWDLVVGFDSSVYNDVDALVSLHGQEVEMYVVGTDFYGDSAEATLLVEISAE